MNISARRPDIQGLRAIAVVLVIFSHLPNIGKFSGGFVGVDIFFVISGYVITRLLLQKNSEINSISAWRKYRGFMWGRVRRLVPALFVMLVIVLPLAFTLAPPAEFALTASAALWSEIFGSNFFFLENFDSYWNPEILRNPFLHTWSLGVEFQVYLVLPLCLVALFIMGSVARRSRILSTAFVLTASVLSAAAFAYFLSRGTPFRGFDSAGIAFYSPFTRFWEFGMGSISILLVSGKARLSSTGFVSAGGWLLLLVGTLGSHVQGTISFWLAPIVLGTSLLLMAGEGWPESISARSLATRPLVWVGDRSYSLYLYHWPALMVALWLWPGNVAAPILAIIVAFLASDWSYRWIERRSTCRNVSRSRAIRKYSSFGFLFGVAATLTVTVFLSFLASQAWYVNPYQITPVHFRQAQIPANAVMDAVDGCDVQALQITCQFYSAETPQVVIIGDSLSNRSFPAVALAAKLHGFNATQMWTGGCGIEFDSCPRFVYDYLQSHQVAGIITAMNFDRESTLINGVERAAGEVPQCIGESTVDCAAHQAAVEKFIVDSRRGLKQLNGYSSRILVSLPFPQQAFNPAQCSAPPLIGRWNGMAKDCGQNTVAWQVERQGLYTEAIREVVVDSAVAQLWDPIDYLCIDGICPTLIDDSESIMDDSIHFSWPASRFIFPPINDFVASLPGSN